ncbi:hypothetical protein L6164_024620 [Bauhinia variegata]|uniref:Uncharacterized protein n=1 Tax=Bauhinia variegata TaxID=167791 RepID=A0ACB9LY07_BAUVA|nr:hypothetical protein L6164_024620 [Bauhinia variegata]
MHSPTLILLLLSLLLRFSALFSLAATDTLADGSSLCVEEPDDILVSPNGDFHAGFFPVGDNAFGFSIWFNSSKEPTLVWMANRDQPVNGKASTLSLLKNGNLILRDAGRKTIWSSSTSSNSRVQLKLMNNGNLVLRTLQGNILWQSFDSPTDTLLPGQPLTERANLVSSRSKTNYSSGFYRLYFDNDNVLRLLFKGPDVSSVFWPYPWMTPIELQRSTYNISKTAVLDPYGQFNSSDEFSFSSTDYGERIYRRLLVDPDGNIRLYSFNGGTKTWEVSWQAISDPCTVHGICGPNSMCTYHHALGRTCYCLQGHKIKNPNDWTQGCVPEFAIADTTNNHSTDQLRFLQLSSFEFYGYDIGIYRLLNLSECLHMCLEAGDNCKAVQVKVDYEGGNMLCYPKTLLLNGRDAPNFSGHIYLKLPKPIVLSSNKPRKYLPLNCSVASFRQLNTTFEKSSTNTSLNILLWFASGIGALELTCIFLVWFCLFRSSKQAGTLTGESRQLLSATGFQRFTYEELKRATRGFTEEIGRGSGGIVYKGILDDDRVAAIKRLSSDSNQGEAEFLAEISTIGMVNHMNLIDMWGYCVHGKDRLLVYEYMEHGSLAENLSSSVLDWNKRFNIAGGTAKGLAYLHEECLEWVLHCDVKPQNILLNNNFQPKVADFGLSKLLNRNESNTNSKFSKVRGTRGYMVPEWVYNFHITSKVDVYSYGIVVLEMITGKNPMGFHDIEHEEGIEQQRLVTWLMEKINSAPTSKFWIEEMVDPNMEGQYDVAEVELLVNVALQCVLDDMDSRPTMSQVVEMLQVHQETERVFQ